jgi:Arc/MetJ-type ribon-helix-helix transcriptional regulator
MKIKLLPEQKRWLEARVAAGEFASREAAVRQIIAERMAVVADDLGWAKPDIEPPRAVVARRDVLSVEEAIADVDAHMASLKR